MIESGFTLMKLSKPQGYISNLNIHDKTKGLKHAVVYCEGIKETKYGDHSMWEDKVKEKLTFFFSY